MRLLQPTRSQPILQPIHDEPMIPSVSLLLLASGAVLLIGGRWTARSQLGGPLCLAVLLAAAVVLARSHPDGGRAGLFVRDFFSIRVDWIAWGLATALTMMAHHARQSWRNSGPQFGLLLLSASGITLIGTANDLVAAFLALELVSLPVVFLLWLTADGPLGREAAMKFLVMSGVSSLLLACGFGLLMTLGGGTDLTVLREVLTRGYAPGGLAAPIGSGSRMGLAALLFILAGLGMRLGLVPLRFERPDVLQGATIWNAGVAALLPTTAAVVAIARILCDTLVGYHQAAELVVIVLAGATIVIGSAMLVVQTQVRRLLAWLTISQSGLLLIALGVAFDDFAAPRRSLSANNSLPGGLQAALFALSVELPALAGFVAVLVYLGRPQKPVEYLEDLTGLGRDEPLAATALLVFLLSLCGLPPLPGFWARLAVLAAALNVHQESQTMLLLPHRGFFVLALAVVVGTVLAAAACTKVVWLMFFDPPIARPRPTGGQPALATATILMLLLVAVGVLPGPVLSYWSRIPRPPGPVQQPGGGSRAPHQTAHRISNPAAAPQTIHSGG